MLEKLVSTLIHILLKLMREGMPELTARVIEGDYLAESDKHDQLLVIQKTENGDGGLILAKNSTLTDEGVITNLVKTFNNLSPEFLATMDRRRVFTDGQFISVKLLPVVKNKPTKLELEYSVKGQTRQEYWDVDLNCYIPSSGL